MGLLTPLYALAAIAILGPILFHLIRRQPQGRLQFSSLMFLRTSPPRLTRRSRLDNLLLLLLRALALIMIALAFSRPYWRQKDLVSQTAPARTVVLLVDTSASMQRTDVWKAAITEAQKVLSSLSAEDQVALYTIDSDLKPIVSLDASSAQTQKANSTALVTQALRELKPTWRSGKLSAGLIGLADQLSVRSLGAEAKAITDSQIVLISDFHVESGLDGLQGYAWPSSIPVDLRVVGNQSTGNARATLMQAEEGSTTVSPEVKMRVENNAHSTQEALTLTWLDGKGNSIGTVTSIQVPAGQVRVVKMPPRPEGSTTVRLSGDGWSGDNDVFVPSSEPVNQRIIYCGGQPPKEEDDLSFFLSQAPLSNSLFAREVTFVKPADLSLLEQAEDVACVVVEPIPEVLPHAETIHNLAKRGLNIVVVLTQQASGKGVEQFLTGVFHGSAGTANTNDWKISEAQSTQHAMISYVDYKSIVFASLADPRFNDFSKIRIWKHRQLQTTQLESSQPSTTVTSPDNPQNSGSREHKIETLARLDDDSPWLLRKSFEQGNLWLFTCGWQPTESTFALSSKFIPVMMNLIDPNPRRAGFTRVVDVAESIEVEDQPPLTVTNQMGQAVDVSLEAGKIALDEPGLYSIKGNRWNQQFAVQIPINESRLTALDPSVLLQYGMGTTRVQSEQEIVDRLRQMKIEELEQQQKIWKWLLVVGMGILLMETLLAGLAAKKV